MYNVRCVSGMVRADIPLSAVDFHVSSIVEEMVNVDEISQKAKVCKLVTFHFCVLLKLFVLLKTQQIRFWIVEQCYSELFLSSRAFMSL